MTPTFSSRLRLFSTGFRYANSRLFIGRADLYFDRLELIGWGNGHSGKRIIPLASVERFDFGQADGTSAYTTLHLAEGDRISLRLKRPEAWKQQIMSRLEWKSRLEHRRPVPDGAGEWTMKELINYSTSMS